MLLPLNSSVAIWQHFYKKSQKTKDLKTHKYMHHWPPTKMFQMTFSICGSLGINNCCNWVYWGLYGIEVFNPAEPTVNSDVHCMNGLKYSQWQQDLLIRLISYWFTAVMSFLELYCLYHFFLSRVYIIYWKVVVCFRSLLAASQSF